MYNIAVDALSVPATTAPVERVFSRASYILSKIRQNLSNEKLEMKLLCKFNSDLLALLSGFLWCLCFSYVMSLICSKSNNSEGEKVCLSIITCSNVKIRNSNVL